MKNLNLFFATLAVLALILAAGCKKETPPEPENPEELITTLRATFSPQAGGTAVVMEFKDLDGDGPNAPVVTGGKLDANTAYDLSLTLLNETEPADMNNPEYNITLEIEEEALEHQFFFQTGSGLNLDIRYADQDSLGKPLGLNCFAQTGASGNGSLTIILRHEPAKDAPGVSDGDITNAGGETDLEATFPVEVP